MASIESFVDECLLISNAQSTVNEAIYEELAAVNFEDMDKTYPMFLLAKTPTISAIDYGRNHLPAKIQYNFTMYWMNSFTEEEKVSTTLQNKQAELQVISDQFLAELITRNVSSNFIISKADIDGNFVDDAHNDRVVQLVRNVPVTIQVNTSCTLGIFSYAVLNDTFDDNILGWTATGGATLSHDVANLKLKISGASGGAEKTFKTIVGNSYSGSLDVSFPSTPSGSSSFTLTIGTVVLDLDSPADGGNKSFSFTANETDTKIKVSVNSEITEFSIDNVVINES